MRWFHARARSIRTWLALAPGAVLGCGDPSSSGSSATEADAGSGPPTEATEAMSEASSAAASGTAAGSSDPGPLVDLAAWVPAAPEDDPWAAERPGDAVCDAGYLYEDMVFEVDTEICTFGTFVQPTLRPVAAGDELELILLHDNLFSEDEDVEAHVAIALSGMVIWETTIAIPAVQDLVRPTFTAPDDAPAGTTVHFHVHNHGYNNYRMVGLEVL